MITQTILGLVKSILTPIFSVLPTGSPIKSTLDGWQVGSALSSAGAKAAPFNAIFPLVELAVLMKIVLGIILPVLVGYIIINWVWRHIPDIAGFGPGSG